jgi:hypothetical protein
MIFKTFTEFVRLREAADSMSRLMAQAQDNGLMVIISASRDSEPIYPFSQDNWNLRGKIEKRRRSHRQSSGATRDLEREVRQAWEARFGVDQQTGIYHPGWDNHLGFKKTYGTYPEEKPKGSGIYTKVLEDSLFITHPKEGLEGIPHEQLVQFFLGLAEKYGQIGVIIRLPGEYQAYEYFTSHSSETPGSRRPYNFPRKEEAPDYSTRLRKMSDDRHLVYDPDFGNPPQPPSSYLRT